MSCEDEHHSHGHGHIHGHGHSHGDGDDGHVPPIPTNEAQSLQSKIDHPHITGLNVENPPEEIAKIFRTSSEKFKLKPVLKSDADAQMIIHVPFLNSSVKLYSIVFRTNGSKYCPKTIKLFKNDKSIDFDNAESKKADLVISHPQVGVLYNEIGGDDDDDDDALPDELTRNDNFVEHHVPRHKFSGVRHLTIFIESIHEEDEEQSRVHYVDLRGESTELTKDPVITIYESAANPADHKSVAQDSVNFSLEN